MAQQYQDKIDLKIKKVTRDKGPHHNDKNKNVSPSGRYNIYENV